MNRILPLLLLLLPLAAPLLAQGPSDAELTKLLRQYLTAEESELAGLEQQLAAVPPLDRKEAAAWVKRVERLLRTTGPRLKTKGTGYFYDEREKKGKYIVAGGGNRKGLVIGLHGGGVGSADCTGAASTFRGAIQSMGMVGIFPEAIEATEAAWGDDVTVRFILDLLAAAQRTFRFDPDRVYVVGHSMGGYGAWTWGGRFADRLAGCASFAGGPTPVWGDEHKVIGIQDGVIPSYFNIPLWVYHSDDDPRVPIDVPRYAVEQIRKMKKEHPDGFDFVYEEMSKRGHAMAPKGARPALQWLAKRKRVRRPKKLIWQPFYARTDQRYWLEWTRPTPGYQVIATWDGKSAFDVTGDPQAAAVAILLEDGMCDLDRPITLSFDGEKLREATCERRLLVLAQTARRRWDPGLLFTARLPLRQP